MIRQFILIIGLAVIIRKADAQSFTGIDNCHESFRVLSDETKLIENVKSIRKEIEENPETRRTLLDNPSDTEALKQKLARCSEELMKRGHYKALEAFIDNIIAVLNVGMRDLIRDN
jgi:hypothetical protein